jgi:ribosomal protein S18 acetylase RimI-like enzyme
MFDFSAVRPASGADRDFLRAQFEARWGGVVMALHGEVIDMTALPALLAGDTQGFVVYRVHGAAAEIVALDAVEPGVGVGTALVVALTGILELMGVQEVWATTTNDNLDALRFYQRRGFRIEGVRRDAVAEVRHLKPSIPVIGAFDIPVCDEIDLRAPLPLRWVLERRTK